MTSKFVLPPSWVDSVPVASTARRFLFNYTTHNFEGALLNFSVMSVELGTANVAASPGAARSFATGPGEAIFYSGGKAAFQAATQAAASEGGKTISMTLGGRVLEKITTPATAGIKLGLELGIEALCRRCVRECSSVSARTNKKQQHLAAGRVPNPAR